MFSAPRLYRREAGAGAQRRLALGTRAARIRNWRPPCTRTRRRPHPPPGSRRASSVGVNAASEARASCRAGGLASDYPHLWDPHVRERTGTQKLVILNGVRGVKDLTIHRKAYNFFRALWKQTTSLFPRVKCTQVPSAHAFIGVGLVRPREVLRFEDCAQDDKI